MTIPIKAAAITGITVLAFVILFLFIDGGCTDSANGACRVWKGFQWESIVAGVLGLAAGIFVIHSTRVQIDSTLATLDQARQHRADEQSAPLYLVLDFTEETRRWANEKIAEIEAAAEEVTNAQRTTQSVHDLATQHQNEIKVRCEMARRILAAHDTTTFNFEVNMSMSALIASETLKDTDHRLNQVITRAVHDTYGRLVELRTRSSSVNTKAKRQIDAIKERCGVMG